MAIDRAITVKGSEIAACADHLKTLKQEYDGLIGNLRAAARDEGALPLFAELEDERDRLVDAGIVVTSAHDLA